MEEPSGYMVVRVLGLPEGRRMHLWGSPMRLRMADVYDQLECDAVDILHVLFGERERLLAFNAGPLKGYSFNKFTQNEVIYVVLIKKPGAGSFLTFGSSTSPFGWHQHAGSRGTFYAVTEDEEGTGKLMCISAMTAYKNKSAEELRWEDYQAGYKGSPSPKVQQLAAGSFGQAASSTPFGGTPTFSTTPTPNPFGAITSSIFGSKPAGSSAIRPFPSPFITFSSVSAFGPASSPAFGSGISPPIETGSTPSFASGFGISSSAFGSLAPAFSSVDGFSSPPNMFNTGSGAFGSNLFGQSRMTGALFSTSNQLFGVSASTLSTPTIGSSIFGSSVSPFQLSKPAGLSQPGASISGAIQSNPVLQQTMGSFGFPSPRLSQPAASAFGAPSIPEAGLSMSTQQPSVPVPISNPFGSLPATPQMSNGHSAGTGPSVKFGISSLPLSEGSTQVQITSLQNPRHITRSRVRVQARQYHPNKNSPKVFFFGDDEETPNTPKVEAFCTGQGSDLHRDANSSPILSVLTDIHKLLTEVCNKLHELKPITVAIESLNTCKTGDMTAISSGNTEV